MSQQQEEDILCSKCRSSPEDVLILTCEHNLCLTCAAENLHNQELKQQNSFSTVVCEICNSATVLDPESATELIEIYEETQQHQDNSYRQTQNEPIVNLQQQPQTMMNQNNNYSMAYPAHNGLHTSQQSSNSTMARDYQNPQFLPNAQQPMPTSQSQRSHVGSETPSHLESGTVLYCQAHPDEVVTYFSFTASNSGAFPLLCAECIINGPHKDDEVQQLKKCYPYLQQQIQNLQGQIQGKIDQMNVHEQKLATRKREVVDRSGQAKVQIKAVFEDIRKKLDSKEREFLQTQEQTASANISEIDQAIRLVKGRSDNLHNKIGELQDVLSSQSPTQLAQFFTSQYEIVLKSCVSDSELTQLKELPQAVTPDLQVLDQFVEQIKMSINQVEQYHQQQQTYGGSIGNHNNQAASMPSAGHYQQERIMTYNNSTSAVNGQKQMQGMPPKPSAMRSGPTQQQQQQHHMRTDQYAGEAPGDYSERSGGMRLPLQTSVAEQMNRLQSGRNSARSSRQEANRGYNR